MAYLGVTNTFAALLLPGSDRDKDAEILALRHQIAVLHRKLDGQRLRFDAADRAVDSRAYGVSKGWVSKLVARYRSEGEAAFGIHPKLLPAGAANHSG